MFLAMRSTWRRPEDGMRRRSRCRGFGSAGVLEVVEDWRGNTYRAVYTVRFEQRVYVLHVFQKKSKSGIATPKPDIDLIRGRLKVAASHAKELKDGQAQGK